MNHEMLQNIWYLLIAVIWILYIGQETYILGSGMLNVLIAKDDTERKQIQSYSGLHWDGIEVWLILAIGGLFASFPGAYATTLEALYIPFFLLLYAIIARGLSIELIYKTDNIKVKKILINTWAISSFLMIFVLGVYLTNIFYGLPIDEEGMTKSFLSIFNLPGILGGILFTLNGLVAGAAWIAMSSSKELADKAVKKVKYVAYILPWLIPLIFQGLNSGDVPISTGELLRNYPVLYAVAGLAFIFALVAAIGTAKKKEMTMFIASILSLVSYVAFGFVAKYPYIVPSSISEEHGLSIFEKGVSSSYNTLNIMFIFALIFVPIVLIYQGFKYYRFSRKINDKLKGEMNE